MKLKLPPKLLSPYTQPEWLDLGYDKDSKFTKALKFLNLALIQLKKTKPPTAEAFQDFTEQTAYLIKRLKKMLADSEMPENVREEFCEPLYQLLRKWQKGALKVQDILADESEESAAETASATGDMQKSSALAKTCIKDYTTLAQSVNKALKDITQLNTLVTKGATSPKLDAAVEQVRAGKLQLALEAAQNKCSSMRNKLPEIKALDKARSEAKGKGNNALASLTASVAAQLQGIDKLSKAVGDGIGQYQKTASALLLAHGKRSAA